MPAPIAPAKEAAAALIARLHELSDPRNVEGMARFGISAHNTLGVSVTTLRAIARTTLRKDAPPARGQGADPAERAVWRHEVAVCLWDSEVHEARMLATLLDDPASVTRDQALEWAHGSDSWDLTDGLALNLLDRTPFAYELPAALAASEHEFARRAAFALIAALAWHDKAAPDERFVVFLPLIAQHASDPRNFVKKAVSWALRHIGKRSVGLYPAALSLAEELAGHEDRAERWVGRDAVRELASEKVRQRLGLA